jgi:hypothetical protein
MKPLLRRTVVWRRVDTVGVEYAEIERSPLVLRGQVVVIEDGVPFAVTYCVECDSAGTTARTLVRCKKAEGDAELLFARSATGRWTMNGLPQPQLDGAADIDLSITPATNTIPIQRLSLSVGQSAEVTAAWLRFPSLGVAPLRQVYRRLSAVTYAYEAPDLGFAAELECDDDGVVRTYAGLWTRVSADTPGASRRSAP